MKSRTLSAARLFIPFVCLALVLSLLLPFSGGRALAAPAQQSGPYPIILLHGIMGSNLDNNPPFNWDCWLRPSGEIWLNLLGIINPISYNERFKALYLRPDGITPANTCDRIAPTSLIGLVYGPVVDDLRSAGYTVYPYAYDWRLDIDVTVGRLNTYINSLGVSKVTLVTHSMGGLVARRFTSDATRSQKVDKVVTIAAPFWGAPVMAKHMRAGTTPLPFDIIIDNDNVHAAVKNFPGAMQLLPSEAYFSQSGPYYIKQNTSLTSYAATQSFFGEKGQNTALISQARLFHSTLDDFRNGVNVPFYALAASHLATPSRIREYTCWFFFTCWEEYAYAAGDGTVPWASAHLSGNQGDWSGTARVCQYLAGTITKDHGSIMEDPNVMEDALRLIAGQTPLHCQYSDPSRPQSADLTQGLPPFTQIRLVGEARLTLTDDAGRITGYTPDGKLERQIPDVTIDAGQRQTTLTFPTGGNYTLTMHGQGRFPAQLTVTHFQANSSGEFTPYQRALYFNLPATAGSQAMLPLAPAQNLPALSLSLTPAGNGPTQILAPSSLLDEAALQDLTPPVTQITLQGQQNASGLYQGPVQVELSAADDATGVYATYYSLDGGQTWQAYSGPFQVEAQSVQTLQARSLDLAGNQEVAWPEALVGGLTLFLPVTTR